MTTLRQSLISLLTSTLVLSVSALYATDAVDTPAPVSTTVATASALASPDPTEDPNAPALTLEIAVAQALGANFDVKLQRLSTSSSADSEEIARATFDPRLSASVATGVNENPALRDESRATNISATKKIDTGATFTATSRLDRNERAPSGTGLNPAYNSDLGLSIRQPLLKGRGREQNLAGIERARLGTLRSRSDLTSAVLAVIHDIEVAYANYSLSREQLGVRAFSLQVREKLLEENRARRDTGVATDLEVLQAEVGVANASRDLLLSRQSTRDRADELLRLMGREQFDAPLGPVSLPAIEYTAHNPAAVFTRALANTPEYASARASVRQQEIDVSTTKNARQPQLDLGASAGFNGKSGTADRAVTDLGTGDIYNWQLDLTLSFPWGFREENARIRQSRSGLERENIRLRQIEQNLIVQVRNAVRALETSQENLRLSALSTKLSARQFELEKARYESGLSTFRAVQQSQDDLDLARLSELQAGINLRVAQANLDRLEGSALARYRITLFP
jgi:outer membrane protein TolC